ncbi:unnamed protein product [Hymenolepis diminuta]|uniref:C2H2-type domain-containing protein n=1 Tax=Hymenolepis diminuta TaxID=6216 RepID=A0A564YY95_HYMDI|nr:unnamed protein product [Hymenolepis diminuta]
MQYLDKNSILRLLEHQPQVNGVRKMKIVCMDAQCHRLLANACEMRRHWRTNNHRNADISQIERFSCSMNGCYKSCEKRVIAKSFESTPVRM